MPTRTLVVLAVVGYVLFVHKPDTSSGSSSGTGSNVSPGGKQQPDPNVKAALDTAKSFIDAARQIAGEFAGGKSSGSGSRGDATDDGSTVANA